MSVMVRYSDELYHHGIKGQKWGVRRYQNEDGSLTYEGKIRYARDLSRKADQASIAMDVTNFRSRRADRKLARQTRSGKISDKTRVKSQVYKTLKEKYENEYAIADKKKTEYYDKLYKEYGRAKVNNSILMEDLGRPGLIGAGIGAMVLGVVGGLLAGPAGAAAGFDTGAVYGVPLGAGVKYLVERKKTGGSVRKRLKRDYKETRRGIAGY